MNDIIPWALLEPWAMYILSDRHYGDPDEHTVDRHGQTGSRLWRYTMDQPTYTVMAGDFVHYPSRKALLHILREGIVLPNRIIVGNHDADMMYASLACYHDADYMIVRDTIVAHGDGAQHIWDPRLRIGQAIIRYGAAMEEAVQWSDDAIMRTASWADAHIVPRGWRQSRKIYLDWAASMMMEYCCSTLVQGHTHTPGVWVYSALTGLWYEWNPPAHWREAAITYPAGMDLPDGLMVVDTGSWMPSHHDHPQGWYRRGDVAPMMWAVDTRVLYRVWADGLEVIVDTKEKGN